MNIDVKKKCHGCHNSKKMNTQVLSDSKTLSSSVILKQCWASYSKNLILLIISHIITLLITPGQQ